MEWKEIQQIIEKDDGFEKLQEGVRKAIRTMHNYGGSGFSMWVYYDGEVTGPHTSNTHPHPHSQPEETPILIVNQIELDEYTYDRHPETEETKPGYLYVKDEGWIDEETVIENFLEAFEAEYIQEAFQEVQENVA